MEGEVEKAEFFLITIWALAFRHRYVPQSHAAQVRTRTMSNWTHAFRILSPFLLMPCLALAPHAHAAAIHLEEGVQSLDLGGLLELYVDPTGDLTIDQVAAPAFAGRFQPSAEGKINHGRSDAVFWVRLRLSRAAAASDHWVLEHGYAHLRYLTLYQPIPGDGDVEPRYVAHPAAYSAPFHARDIEYRNSAFDIPMEEDSKTLYLRLASSGPIILPLTLWHPRAFAERKLGEMAVIGGYFGLLLAMLLYNASLYVSLRDRAYIYYVGYVAFVGALILGVTGVGYQYLWSESADFGYHCPLLFGAGALVFCGLFAKSFLVVKTNAPFFDRLLTYMIAYWAITTWPLVWLHWQWGYGYVAFQISAAASVLLLFAAGIAAWLRGYAAARFYLLSFVPFIAATLLYLFRNLGGLPFDVTTSNGLLVGSAMEVLLLSTALADRVQIFKREKETAQHELARVVRLNAMGEMASGLAHELNQPLGCAANYLLGVEALIDTRSTDTAEFRKGVALSLRQIERAGAVVRHMRNFTRHHTPTTAPTDVNVLIKEIVAFLDFEIRRQNVRLDLRLSKKLPEVLADRLEIGQVLLNLIKNGIDAMADVEADERLLTVSTRATHEGVEVTVRDSGPGVSAEFAERLFEAFFTTKHDGQGLGLAICRTLVRSHGGRIWTEPAKPGEGACFKFTLPQRTTS